MSGSYGRWIRRSVICLTPASGIIAQLLLLKFLHRFLSFRTVPIRCPLLKTKKWFLEHYRQNETTILNAINGIKLRQISIHTHKRVTECAYVWENSVKPSPLLS